MKAKPGVQVTTRDGWTVIADKGGSMLWTFTPPGHPAHPTVARREGMQRADGSWYLNQNVLCEAAKATCDKINAEFVELNNQMRREIKRARARPDRVPSPGN